MTVLFLHGLHSVPGGDKPTYLSRNGHSVLNPALPDDDFAAAVDIAQAEYDEHQPDVIVGSSRGGAVAMNIQSRNTPLVLLCPAWKKYGAARSAKLGTVILHSRADDVVPFADSVELVDSSGLPATALIEVGADHRLADPDSLAAMLRACVDACVPKWLDSVADLLEQDWGGLCYTAVLRWITAAEDDDWIVMHGSVLSAKVGKRIDHAWCERGDLVVDLAMPVGARIIARERYYRVVDPEIRKSYAVEDALTLSIKSGHDGPWDEAVRAEIL